MRKALGEILVKKGDLSARDLDRALAYQVRMILGTDPGAMEAAGFLIEVARTKYNRRDAYSLGKILSGLKLVPEEKVVEALKMQKRSRMEKPRSRLDALNRIMARLNSSYDLIDLLNQILVLAAEMVNAHSASLTVFDSSRDTLVIIMPTGPRAEAVRNLEVPRGKGIVGWVHAHGQSVICNDTSRDRRFYAPIDAASGFTSRQILCVPLTVKDRRMGAIEAINRKVPAGKPARGFSREDLLLLEAFSAQTAIAIESTRIGLALAQARMDLSPRAPEGAAAADARAGALVAESLLNEMKKALIPLKGYAARIEPEGADPRVQKYRGYIDREMDRLIAHADDMARFLGESLSPALDPLEMGELLKDLEARIWVECRTAGISLEMQAKDEVTMMADRVLLLSALVHVFRNSRNAMPRGGAFRVTVSKDDGNALIEVADTGTGIDADPVERIFEPFYTHGTPHGAGLGLSIARKIVELHGGTIRAANRQGSPGAVVTITLPVG